MENLFKKRLRQWVSHGASKKWSLWTELVGGREWMPHAPRGAKSKKKKLEFEPLLSCMYFIHKQIKCLYYYCMHTYCILLNYYKWSIIQALTVI